MIGFYDVVVVGDELAGAVSAALLARRGYRVLMLCSAPVEQDLVGPYGCTRAPSVLVGLETPTLKRLGTELNLVQVLRRRVTPNRPAYQLLLPDQRIDVGEDTPRELQRELPDDAARFETWSASAQAVCATLDPILGRQVLLPPEGFWDRRDLKRISAQLPRDDSDLLEPLPSGSAIRALVGTPVRFACDFERPGVIAHARLGELYARGTWTVQGGRDGLRAMFLERLRTYAGEIRHDVQVRGLVTRRGRVVGVAVGDRDQTVGCHLTIGAMSASELAQLLPEDPPRRLRDAALVPASHHRYRLHLVAPLEALPDPLGPLAFAVRDPAAPLEGANAFALHVASGHGQHAVITLEALATDASPEGLAALRRDLRREMDRLFPFLDRHVRAAWSPHEAELPEGVNAAPPIALPLATDPIWSFPEAPALGVCGLTYGTGAKGLLLASRQVLPGLGLEGELAAGLGAAQLVTTRQKRRDVDKTVLFADG